MWNLWRKAEKPAQKKDVEKVIETRTFIIPPEITQALAIMGFDVTAIQSGTMNNADIFPITADINRAKAKLREPLIAGDMVEGQGIYVGQWHLNDDKGDSLGKVFNIYAAPEDLVNRQGERAGLTYARTVSRVRALQDWHGYNGGDYNDSQEIKAALVNGSYQGGWVIPPIELLRGINVMCTKVAVDNLFALRKSGAFKDSYATSGQSLCWYWSSSSSSGDANFAIGADFVDGDGVCGCKKTDTICHCRPIRFVEVS